MMSFFLQPLLLTGTLLVAVPIIIYLINRQRFQRRKWAAMEFLLKAMRKNRRRLRFENLLLLLIRCLIVALLAIAMARPFIRSQVLSSASSQSENWIFAIDTSYSMGLREGTRTLFESARETISRIVQQDVKPGDRVAIVTIGGHPRAVLSPRQVTESSRGQILDVVADLKSGYEPLNLAASLRSVLDMGEQFESLPTAETAISTKKLLLFTDFQRKDWLVDDSPRDPAVIDLLRQLERSGIRVGRPEVEGSDSNLTVTSLAMSPPIASVGVWVEFFATVRNTGKEDFDAVEIVLRVDGVDQPSQLVRLAAGAKATRVMAHRFGDPGYHSVTVEVLIDDLPVDNRRHLAVSVRESAEVLLVDGDPGVTIQENDTVFLELALAPDESDEFRRAPYQSVFMSLDQALAEAPDMRQYLAIVLANVSAADLSETFVDELRRYVHGGGALLFFAGDNVVAEDYNRVFYRDGNDLLPLRMVNRVEVDRNPAHLQFADHDHPVARYFILRRDYSNIEERLMEFKRYMRFETVREATATDPSIAMLLRFDDAERSLAAFDSSYGRGRVMWYASSADLDWNNLPAYPDMVPFIHETLPYLVGFGENSTNLTLGEPFRQVYEAHEFAPRVVIVPPRPVSDDDTGLPSAIPRQMRRLEGEDRFELLHEETLSPGLYEIRLQRPLGETAEDARGLFAVNLDPTEGDLRRISDGELAEHFPDLKAEVFAIGARLQNSVAGSGGTAGTELWRTILWAVLLLLIAETVLAFLFQRRAVK